MAENRLVDAVIFDLDGTVYLGDAALPGAVDGIAGLRQRGVRTMFVSNKPLEPRAAYAAKLTRLGIPTPADDVITSAFVLAHYLGEHGRDLRYYVLGEENLRQELRDAGLLIVDELADQDPKEVIQPLGIDAVIVALDRTLDYRKLNTAYQALRRGARYFATNADDTCPMPGGAIPDAGATLAALQQLTGRRPELVAGKPSPLILGAALDSMGVPAARCLMVGDRLETDLRMGQQAGMLTAVPLTGVSTREDIARFARPPDFVIGGLHDLLALVAP
ncbi:MAG TPA: HAD-IIA family hydrolase [Phycisphaerae bacterium]|nr:HAD-IIA family hydrolase [Phycisphaerae bacterium]